MFTDYAEKTAHDIRESVPSFHTVFELLRDPYERDHVADAALILEAYGTYGDLSGMIDYAAQNKTRDDINPILQWLHENACKEPRHPVLDKEPGKPGVARKWIDEHDPERIERQEEARRNRASFRKWSKS